MVGGGGSQASLMACLCSFHPERQEVLDQLPVLCTNDVKKCHRPLRMAVVLLISVNEGSTPLTKKPFLNLEHF